MTDKKSTPEVEEVVANDQQPEVEDASVEASEVEVDQLEIEDAAADKQAIESLQTEVNSLQNALVEAQEQALRAQAEAQNIKRRSQQDVEKAHKFALEGFSKSLLPIIDSLERGLETANRDEPGQKAMCEGIELTLKMFIDVLQKHNVEQLDPVGEPFDPQYHEAMSMQESPDAEPGTVLAALQKGYTLNGRLIRPAMVIVAKPSETKIDEKA
ncbi:nucleotide exchange factor GrpE [Zooshikella ganghwensis]|uniref:nucleotide exchange factor GrpE n=1 Tax=Zooshikella ganghwensis TaxID=202772 RepID=UPI000421910E|nr:nucleotide exchange factor GrpE [Zooshikella ganghwensis]